MINYRAKYNSKITTVDGIKFSSKLEAKYYNYLKNIKSEINFILMQTPFRLTGGVHYRADFMVFWKDGKIDIIDVKGVETAMYKLKKKQVEELYPVKIKVVKKGDF